MGSFEKGKDFRRDSIKASTQIPMRFAAHEKARPTAGLLIQRKAH